MIAGLVPGAPHLHDAKLALHPELALVRESQVEDSVREVLLFVPRVRRPGPPVRARIGTQLAQENCGVFEARRPGLMRELALVLLLETSVEMFCRADTA